MRRKIGATNRAFRGFGTRSSVTARPGWRALGAPHSAIREPARTLAEPRAELPLHQWRAYDAGQAFGDRPPVELGGDLAGRHGNASVSRQVDRQDSVEDHLDLVAGGVRS